MTSSFRRSPIQALTRVLPTLVPVILLLTSVAGCATNRLYVAPRHEGWPSAVPPPQREAVYQAFLIGDAGGPRLDPPEPTLKLLRTHLDAAGPDGVVVFLGDNLYCCGLPDSGAAARPLAEARLRALLSTVEGYKGRVVFLPGNHDWNPGRAGGLETLARQEAFVEAHLDKGNVFLPDDGLPGPVEVKLMDDLTLVVLDTEWWLRDEEKTFGDAGTYELTEPGDFLLQLDDIVKRARNEKLLVVGHHPVHSNGAHAGYFSLRTHLFPLTALWRNAYVPLPLVGSLYPLFVRFFGGRQDLANARYEMLRDGLRNIFGEHEALIYAAGHDHSLQYFGEEVGGADQHYLVSGAGSRLEPVAAGNGAGFSAASKGFMTVTYYQDGSAWLEVWTPVGDGSTGAVLFRTRLHAPGPPAIDANDTTRQTAAYAYPDYRDSTVVRAAHAEFEAGPVKTFLFGEQHRDAWATPVTLPVLDLGHEAGGLTPLQRGGGMQTTSLRLQGADGKQYVLRSLLKDPTRNLPDNLKRTGAAGDILRDQVSIIHPYGALIIPRLADAAGVYHTNPKVVYVPHDPRLGPYLDLVGGQVMLLEERPDEDMSDVPSFGRSQDVVGAPKMYRAVTDDNDHRVDQQSFARARLFDMLLADWDRHRDQWRWATFEPGELDSTLTGEAATQGKIYRPIPRDRDWALSRMGGLFPSIVKSRYVVPKFQDFGYEYGYLLGLNENGFSQDRRFTNALTERDWIDIAEAMQQALTDDVIEAAVHDWPAPIAALNGAEFIDKLKARRAQLPSVAASYYRILAKVVDVIGSNKHERFEVSRLGGGETLIVVHKTTKAGEIREEIYRRQFHRNETKELRLYGLDGNDQFEISGDADVGIDLIAVGGGGDDRFTDRSDVARGGKKARFFDTPTGGTFDPGTEARVITAEDPAVNAYDPAGYQVDEALPQLFFGSNADDGFFLGGGVRLIRHGFRKQPYAASHRIVGNIAARTQAFNLVYQGHFTSVLGAWDAGLNTEWRTPNNIRNFYGLGNESRNEVEDATYYQARLQQIIVEPTLLLRRAPGLTFFAGPTFRYYDVAEDPDRFISEIQPGISEDTFRNQWYAGARGGFAVGLIDQPVNPLQGIRWSGEVEANVPLREGLDHYATLSTDLRLYYSLSFSPQVTLAVRLGGAHNIGSFPFFGANTLGGQHNLRGYRGTRFAGRTSFYQNVDVRLQLFGFSTYVAQGKVGVLGFFDNGRVWTDGEHSRLWHQGYGGGLWTTLLDTVALTGTVGASKEGNLFTLKLGFAF